MSEFKVGLGQIAPVWLDKEKTTSKVCDYIAQAADESCSLVVFGGARTCAARFISPFVPKSHETFHGMPCACHWTSRGINYIPLWDAL